MTHQFNSNYTTTPLGGKGAAIIFAAGLGTRLKPFTNKHPKALAVVNGKPLLQRNIEYLQQHGITNIIVNVHHFASQIIDAIEHNNGWGSQVCISDETDEVLETGGGLKRASSFFANVDDFVVINVDILTDLNLTAMLQSHKAQQPLATLATSNRKSSRYFLFNEADELCGWMNDKTGEQRISKPTTVANKKAFSGMHIISSKLLPLITQEGKFSMVDVYLNLAPSHIIKSFDHSNSKFIDVGKPENIVLAETMFD
ncbi:MAG: sugar phosphate nucleotidyltransferase [Flavobacterium sp.]|nr:sugar phosphate nucleotidyltransferase [Flavobacterium sp.]